MTSTVASDIPVCAGGRCLTGSAPALVVAISCGAAMMAGSMADAAVQQAASQSAWGPCLLPDA